MKTISEAIRWGLQSTGESSYPADYQTLTVLLARILNRSQAELLAKLSEEIPQSAWRKYLRNIKQYTAGTPLAYILGTEEFLGHSFQVGPGVLIPRPETETLANLAIERIEEFPPSPTLHALELCCGSACITLSAALRVRSRPIRFAASDISESALRYAWKNLEAFGPALSARPAVQVRLYQSDLFAHPELQRSRHLIYANPPYLSSAEYERRSHWAEPIEALSTGRSGLEVLTRIIRDARALLLPGGSLLLEAAPWQMYELREIMLRSGYRDPAIAADCHGLPRVISARI